MKNERLQTMGEEIANTVTHVIGSHLGAAMLALLVRQGVLSGTQVAWKVTSAAIFGASVILLYAVSSAYHAVTYAPAKRILQMLDHMAIFFLIAGSYTPFCLVTLRPDHPALAWTIFGIEWGLTLVGVAFKAADSHFKIALAAVTEALKGGPLAVDNGATNAVKAESAIRALADRVREAILNEHETSAKFGYDDVNTLTSLYFRAYLAEDSALKAIFDKAASDPDSGYDGRITAETAKRIKRLICDGHPDCVIREMLGVKDGVVSSIRLNTTFKEVRWPRGKRRDWHFTPTEAKLALRRYRFMKQQQEDTCKS